MDHCRIGSLEIHFRHLPNVINDHCRIGSLENDKVDRHRQEGDHCRIGSLETVIIFFIEPETQITAA